MQTRTVALIAASAAAVAVTVTGVTYASADSPQAASSARPASAPLGGGGDHDWKDDGYKKDHDGHKKDDGNIQINERTYGARAGACVAVLNPITPATGAASFNIRNESDSTLEFFSGATCNAGAPVATVGPRSASNAVAGATLVTGAGLPNALVGSFRVIDN
ncbi:hypothetical protein OG800_48570 [Streptomyces sp. NBC_00445]|uniref:hypothetical protein n=1 Tax=Streptomyces sp. NBC_00445 TaxID=2975745 RepID=UPI002E1BE51C